nr:Chain E, C-peptide [synthetic construct]2PV2_F Chain F, C-peptide [synthetic construct]2PV3_C Chain C, C-peptide [synthetic construct]
NFTLKFWDIFRK